MISNKTVWKIILWSSLVLGVLINAGFILISVFAWPAAYPEDYKEFARDLVDWFTLDD